MDIYGYEIMPALEPHVKPKARVMNVPGLF